MADFIINEWLWADASGTSGRVAQLQAVQFIEAFTKSAHRIVIIGGSKFDQKAWALCKSINSEIAKRIGGAFVANIRLNSARCLVLKAGDLVAIPEELASRTNIDDHYLVQAQLSVSGSILVTTDHDLYEAVRHSHLECLLRDEFMRTHILEP